MAEVEQGEPIRPLGDGRACRCDASLVERPVSEVHSMVAVQVVNCLLKAYAIAFELEWGFPSKALDILGRGTRPPNSCVVYHGGNHNSRVV